MKCKKCNGLMYQYKNTNKFICENDLCDFCIVLDNRVQEGISWNVKIAEDMELWCERAFNNSPVLIRHEYLRLNKLLKNGQTYGALLQLKDVFEILLKFPLLIAASEVYNKTERSQEENHLLMELLKMPLALGEWKSINDTLLKNKSKIKINEDIKKLLEIIKDIYDKKGIVQWRNNCIGHGALGFDSDTDFQNDILDKITIIRDYLNKAIGIYSTFRIIVNETIISEKSQIISSMDNTKEIFLDINSKRICLFPFISIKDSGLYLFDSYYSKNNIISVLNYANGNKKESSSDIKQRLINIYNTYLKENSIKKLTNLNSVDNETYMKVNDSIIKKIQEVNDFVKPNYLNKVVLDIFSYEKGVFSLKLEKGLGKSTFIRGIDQLSLNKYKFKDVAIRAYYIHNSYSYKISNFTSEFSDIVKSARGIEEEIGGIEGLKRNSLTKKLDFATILNEARSIRSKCCNQDKIMFIIDGIDEIPATDDISIFDFIPNEDLLDNGVYILLTSREKQELSNFTKNKLSEITFTNKYENFYSESEENKEFLSEYIRKNILKIKNNKKPNNEQLELEHQLLEKSDYKILNLVVLKSLYSINKDINLMKLPNDKEIFTYYLQNLKVLYGEKFHKKIIRLLLVLASAYEKLTHRELDFLLGQNIRSFETLSYLIDLRGFIKIEHSYRESSLISISNTSWRHIIIENYKDELIEMIYGWKNYCDTVEISGRNVIETQWDGETYLLSYINSYLKSYLENINDKFGSNMKKVIDLANYIMINSNSLYQLNRAREINSFIIDNNSKDINTVELYSFYLNRAYINYKLNDSINSEEDINRILNYYTEFNNNLSKEVNELLIEAYLLKASIKAANNNFVEAVNINNRAFELLKELGDLETSFTLKKFVQLLSNNGNAFSNMNKKEKALQVFDKAINLIGNNCTPEFIKMKAYILSNRAKCKNDLGIYKDSLKDYDLAIKLMRKSNIDDDILFMLYNSKGLIYQHYKKMDEAIRIYSKAISLYEKKRNRGEIVEHKIIAMCYYNRSLAHLLLNHKMMFYSDIEKSLNIIAMLHNDKKEYCKQTLSNICLTIENSITNLNFLFNDDSKVTVEFEFPEQKNIIIRLLNLLYKNRLIDFSEQKAKDKITELMNFIQLE